MGWTVTLLDGTVVAADVDLAAAFAAVRAELARNRRQRFKMHTRGKGKGATR